MGNAFIAATNDQSALFYNPAGLESVHNYIFDIVTVGVTVNQQTLEVADASGNDAVAALGAATGGKLYQEIPLSAFSMVGPGWGWSLFGTVVLDTQVHNPVVPWFGVNYYAQTGAVIGGSMSFFDHSLDVGVTYKQISRAGLGQEFHIVDFVDPDFEETVQDDLETGKMQSATDVGAIYHYDAFYDFPIKLAAVMHNIGSLDFGSTGKIPTTLDLGMATETEFLGLDLLAAADFVDTGFAATEQKSWRRNVNLGVELGMWMRSNGHHALSYRMGMKGVYPSSGFTLNVPYLPLEVTYAKWSEEIGSYAGSLEDKRQSVELTIGF